MTDAPASERPPIRVVIADDSYLIRLALIQLLEGADSVVVVGESPDADAVPELLDQVHADVLITDIRMPPSGEDEGIRLATRLRETHPAVGVLVISAYADVTYALKLFEHGCDSRGYLLKDRIGNRRQLVDAVVAVANSGSVTDSAVIETLVHARTQRSSRLGELTPRELETLALVAEGRSNADIAEALVLSKRAVEKHVNAIFAKLALGDPDHVSRRVKAALLYLSDRDPGLVGGSR